MSIEQWSDLMFPESGAKDTHLWGSVKSVNSDGSYEVQLNTSSVTTRCAAGCTAGVGDRVLVCIMANGRCVAVARLGGDLGVFDSIAVGGSEMVDHVVARGNSGDWTYWKFDSGLAICKYAPSAAVITESRTEVSNGYRSESYDAALPFTMKNGTAFGSFVGYLYELRTYLVSSGATLRIIAYTNTAGTISAYPRAVVIGMWK